MTSEIAAVDAVAEAPAAPGSGAAGVWRRLRREPMAMVGLTVAGLLVLAAVAAPLLTALEGQDLTTYHDGLLDSARGGVPSGRLGGLSGEHWLGVEPKTGATCSPAWCTGRGCRWRWRCRRPRCRC